MSQVEQLRLQITFLRRLLEAEKERVTVATSDVINTRAQLELVTSEFEEKAKEQVALTERLKQAEALLTAKDEISQAGDSGVLQLLTKAAELEKQLVSEKLMTKQWEEENQRLLQKVTHLEKSASSRSSEISSLVTRLHILEKQHQEDTLANAMLKKDLDGARAKYRELFQLEERCNDLDLKLLKETKLRTELTSRLNEVKIQLAEQTNLRTKLEIALRNALEENDKLQKCIEDARGKDDYWPRCIVSFFSTVFSVPLSLMHRIANVLLPFPGDSIQPKSSLSKGSLAKSASSS